MFGLFRLSAVIRSISACLVDANNQENTTAGRNVFNGSRLESVLVEAFSQ